MPDETPRSLASFYKQRRRAQPDVIPTETDSAGQMGLLFSSEPQVSASESVAPPVEKRKKEKPEQKTERRVWSVRALVSELREHVEQTYADTWVEGEISNCRLAPSGHLYFTLKDGDAQLPVVMFRRQAMLLRFVPEDGHSVLVRGGVSVYESRGQLQLIAETLEPRGEGALRLAFEQLRAKLLAEGLFDADAKQPLPAFPKRIGIITSPSGAVLRDIYTVTRRRHRCIDLLVFPALMQGAESANEVREGIAYFNSHSAPQVDVILIARGGGSAEDLWGFNDEALAREIAASALPVVSAIGHETDFTIADFVADLRAPTPSAAAEILTEQAFGAEERIESLLRRLERGVRYQIIRLRQQLMAIGAEKAMMRVVDRVAREQQHVDAMELRLATALQRRVREEQHGLNVLEDRLVRRNVASALHHSERRLEKMEVQLKALDPTAVLRRGYALVFDAQGKVVKDASQLKEGDEITAQFAKGRTRATVKESPLAAAKDKE